MESSTGEYDARFSPAHYRVRLFLSVDLSGSTAFKNSEAGQVRDEGATPKWVTGFQKFYTNFPTRFRTNYQKHTSKIVGTDGCPEIWKAVGDELVFCGRVSNKKAIAIALIAFIETLHAYRKLLNDEKSALN